MATNPLGRRESHQNTPRAANRKESMSGDDTERAGRLVGNGGVLPTRRTRLLLTELKNRTEAMVHPRLGRRAAARRAPTTQAPREALAEKGRKWTWASVFGTPEGVLPAVSQPLPTKGTEEYDLWTTKILTPDLREAFAALWVKGDGNCLWRAVSRGLWGIDEYWLQLKLVVLGWGFENVEALLGERVPECFKNAGSYETDIYRKHESSLAAAQSEDQRVAAFAPLLREHIASRCANKAWGGPICAILVAERFGLVVKVIDPGDFLSRRERDAQSHSGGCTDDDHFEDNRLSRQYTPSQKRNIVKVRGFDGEKDTLVHEVVVALCFSCVPITGDSSLPETPVMAGGDKLPILDHFASIVSWGRIDRPTFPFFKAAPPLFPRHDVLHEKELLEWERQRKKGGGTKGLIADGPADGDEGGGSTATPAAGNVGVTRAGNQAAVDGEASGGGGGGPARNTAAATPDLAAVRETAEAGAETSPACRKGSSAIRALVGSATGAAEGAAGEGEGEGQPKPQAAESPGASDPAASDGSGPGAIAGGAAGNTAAGAVPGMAAAIAAAPGSRVLARAGVPPASPPAESDPCIRGGSRKLARDVDDGGEEDDRVVVPHIPDLDYASKKAPAPTFAVLPTPMTTWAAIEVQVKNAMRSRGLLCKTKWLTKQTLPRDEGGRPSSRMLVCRNAGKSTSTPKHADAAKRRRTEGSAKCRCTFGVRVNWNRTSPPTMGKVCLSHVKACEEGRASGPENSLVKLRKDLVDESVRKSRKLASAAAANVDGTPESLVRFSNLCG